MSTFLARMCSKQLSLSRSLTGYYVSIVPVRMRPDLRGMARVYRFRKYLDKMVLINVAVCLLVSLTFYLPRDSSAALCQILRPTPKQWQNLMSGRTLMFINWINNYIAFNINIDPKCSYCTEWMWYWQTSYQLQPHGFLISNELYHQIEFMYWSVNIGRDMFDVSVLYPFIGTLYTACTLFIQC